MGGPMRWTPNCKAEIIIAIENAEISLEEAKSKHALSDEELAAWRRDYAAYGTLGLRVTKLQRYRQLHPANNARTHDLPRPADPPPGSDGSGDHEDATGN